MEFIILWERFGAESYIRQKLIGTRIEEQQPITKKHATTKVTYPFGKKIINATAIAYVVIAPFRNIARPFLSERAGRIKEPPA